MAEEQSIQQVRLGNSGLKVSQVIFGAMSLGSSQWQPWILNEADALPLLKHAYDRGINTWDTANLYSHGHSEAIIGEALRKYSIPRKRVVLMTKCFWDIQDDAGLSGPVPALSSVSHHANAKAGLSRKAIFDAVDASVARLGTYIDVLQIHRFDPQTPPEEIMRALNDVIATGKVRYIGASSMAAWQFAELQAVAARNGWHRFVSMQNHHSLLYREEEREMIPYCRHAGVGLVPWSPLARGVLARPWGESTFRDETDLSSKAFRSAYSENDKAIVDRVQQLAEQRGVSMACVATAWAIAKGDVPIVGLSSKQRIDETVRNAAFRLEDADLKFLEELYVPRPVVGFVVD